MTDRRPTNGIDPIHIGTLKGLPPDDLLVHVEAILEQRGGDPLSDNERNDRRRRRRRRRPARINPDVAC